MSTDCTDCKHLGSDNIGYDIVWPVCNHGDCGNTGRIIECSYADDWFAPIRPEWCPGKTVAA